MGRGREAEGRRDESSLSLAALAVDGRHARGNCPGSSSGSHESPELGKVAPNVAHGREA